MILNDVVLDQLPRALNVREGIARGANASVYVDHTGALCVLIQEVGLLTVPEDDLDRLVVEAY